jgi:SEC-C motif-containing protein
LENDLEGTVAFKAYFKENGKLNYIDEHSKFVKENECWYYLGLA